jgi:hypothetical protein
LQPKDSQLIDVINSSGNTSATDALMLQLASLDLSTWRCPMPETPVSNPTPSQPTQSNTRFIALLVCGLVAIGAIAEWIVKEKPGPSDSPTPQVSDRAAVD